MKGKNSSNNHFLIEIAWEVCNQVGGIYTVLRTKASEMVQLWEEDYLLIGPYLGEKSRDAFEEEKNVEGSITLVLEKLAEKGIEAKYGTWLVSGKPKVLLLDVNSVRNRLNEIKYFLFEHFKIESPWGDELYDDVLLFGECIFYALEALQAEIKNSQNLIAHFHEWMCASSIGFIKKSLPEIKTVFTTHATMLGRYLSNNNDNFYKNLPNFNWREESKKYGIEAKCLIEYGAAQHVDVLTTVSHVTAKECKYLLERNPEVILPNGINIQRFAITHEIHNLHQEFKEEIHQFTMAHFFRNKSFDLDKTLYFFTSGRFEFHNKGFDITVEALRKLNQKMKEEEVPVTVVMFFITRQPAKGINSETLQSRGVMEEVRQTVDQIQSHIGKNLFHQAISKSGDLVMPKLDDLVDEYWKLRLVRTVRSWADKANPKLVTHDLVNEGEDQLLNSLTHAPLTNRPDDKVKVIYHPDFISPMNPLFGIEYGQFVRGCHLGIFPSFYEPWGYTPLECLASGVPAITSDLAGFGEYSLKELMDHQEYGIYVVNRKNESFDSSTSQLANQLFSFVLKSRKDRMGQRNRAEEVAEKFSWKHLIKHYMEAYELCIAN